jgi:hypothetical protein
VRFGHWFIQRKFGVDAEEAALKFEHYFARRLEGDPDGKLYEEALADWQGAKVDQEQLPAAISSLMGLGSVRDNLKSDPEAMGLARKLFGIDKPEDLTDDLLLDMLNSGGGNVRTLVAEGDKKGAKAIPAAKLDSLGRALTLTRVPLKTLLWRTMAMYRNAGIDPKSQVMVRRLWFAAQLEMKIEPLVIWILSLRVRSARLVLRLLARLSLRSFPIIWDGPCTIVITLVFRILLSGVVNRFLICMNPLVRMFRI